MCDSVAINGKMLHRQGDLVEELGGMLVMHGDYMGHCCLCPVDLEATARKYGYECRYSREFFDYEFVRRDGDSRDG